LIPPVLGRPINLAVASDGADPAWIQIAYEGRFDGYPGGGAEFTRTTFELIAKNFRRNPAYRAGADGIGTEPVVPFDYEHASEMDATSGTIPVAGAPAPAWALELDVRDGVDGRAELWALALFGPRALAQVRSGEYRWTSVAVWGEAVDPDTGEPIGPLLTSIALTNHPFLRGMAPLAARARGGDLDSRRAPGHATEIDDMPASELTAKLAAVLKVNPHDELVLAAAEKAVKAAEQGADALDQLQALFGSSDFQSMVAKATELIKKAAEVEPLVAALAAANDRIGRLDQAEAEAEAEAVVASLRLDAPTSARIKPIILSARRDAIGDPAKLDAFRKNYPLPEADRAVLTQRLFAVKPLARVLGLGDAVRVEEDGVVRLQPQPRSVVLRLEYRAEHQLGLHRQESKTGRLENHGRVVAGVGVTKLAGRDVQDRAEHSGEHAALVVSREDMVDAR
jgi:phage I-like protein